MVRINCTADDLESIVIQMNETQEALERHDCKEYPRYDHILCYDLPEFTSTEWLSTQETSESTFETQTSTTPSEMTTLVATTSSFPDYNFSNSGKSIVNKHYYNENFILINWN